MLKDFLEAVLKDDAESTKKEKIRKKVASLKIKGNVDLRTLKVGDNVRFKDGTVAIVTNIREVFRFKEETLAYCLTFSSEVRGMLNEKMTDDSWVYTLNGSFDWPDKEERQYCNNIVEVNPIPRVESKRWMPSQGEDYFVIADNGEVCPCTNRNTKVAEGSHSLGLVYKTREQAEEALEIRKATVKLLDLCDSKGNVEIQYIVAPDTFKAVGDEEVFGKDRSSINSPFHFGTKEDAEKAIKAIGKKMLKKIYNID